LHLADEDRRRLAARAYRVGRAVLREIATGAGSLVRPIDVLSVVAVWPGEVPVALVRNIGALELMGAFGLLLPSLTRIRPALTPLAAMGLGGVMGLATLYNLVHGR
jgi:putative oxidoreductase